MRNRKVRRVARGRHLLISTLVAFAVLIAPFRLTSAQTQSTQAPSEEALDFCASTSQNGDNGIVVGQPKLFNPDTLEKMLREVEAQLKALKFLNSGQVGESVGGVQGGRSTSSSISLNVTGGATSGLEIKTTDKEGTENDVREETRTREARPPEAPAAPPSVSAGIQPSGVAAQDILAEQTALTYQAINLRLLLDRATSDRILSGGKVRQQAVVGFQVSIAPRPEFKNAVAIVEMTLQTEQEKSKTALTDLLGRIYPEDNPQLYEAAFKAVRKEEENAEVEANRRRNDPFAMARSNRAELDYRARQAIRAVPSSSPSPSPSPSPRTYQSLQPPSLVALLPQEKTYNVVSVTKDAKSLGLGAIAGVFSVGFGASKNNETFYVVKDTDTVALQKAPSNANALNFGWHFQPVLGRRIITPGVRQVYAALALPTGVDEDFVGRLSVTTYWSRWDRKTNSPGEKVRVRDCENDGCPRTTVCPLTVYRSRIMEEMLAPQVTDIAWEEAGQGKVRVKIEGANFTPETKIRMGTEFFDHSIGNLEGTAESKLLVLPAANLVTIGRDPLLVTRFGTRELRTREAVTREIEARRGTGLWGLSIRSATSAPRNAETARVTINITQRGNASDSGNAPDLQPEHLLALIGDKVFGLSDKPFDPESGMPDGSTDLMLQFDAPLDLVKKAEKVTVRRPFWGSGFADTSRITMRPGALVVSRVSRLATDANGKVHLAIHGSSFVQGVSVALGEHVFTGTGSNRLEIKDESLVVIYPTEAQLRTAKQLMATQRGEIALLKLAPPPRVPVFKKVEANVGDTIALIAGDDLDTIREVRHFGTTLPVIGNPDGSLTLHVPAEVTKTTGKKGFEVVLQDGSTINLSLNVRP